MLQRVGVAEASEPAFRQTSSRPPRVRRKRGRAPSDLPTPGVSAQSSRLLEGEDFGTVLDTQFNVQNDQWLPPDSEGERRFLTAILEDAISDLPKRYSEREAQRVIGYQAEEWIRSRDESLICSFENICTLLKLNPDGLRRRLLSGNTGFRRSRRVNGNRTQVTKNRK